MTIPHQRSLVLTAFACCVAFLIGRWDGARSAESKGVDAEVTYSRATDLNRQSHATLDQIESLVKENTWLLKRLSNYVEIAKEIKAWPTANDRP